jgi:hypothetical protein
MDELALGVCREVIEHDVATLRALIAIAREVDHLAIADCWFHGSASDFALSSLLAASISAEDREGDDQEEAQH